MARVKKEEKVGEILGGIPIATKKTDHTVVFDGRVVPAGTEKEKGVII